MSVMGMNRSHEKSLVNHPGIHKYRNEPGFNVRVSEPEGEFSGIYRCFHAKDMDQAAAKKESLKAVVEQVQDFLKDISTLREGQERKLTSEQGVLSEKRARYDSALAKQRAFRSTVDEVARETERLSQLKRNLRELKDAVSSTNDAEEDL